ncbi:MAG: azurin [Pseudomonadota bacterium]
MKQRIYLTLSLFFTLFVATGCGSGSEEPAASEAPAAETMADSTEAAATDMADAAEEAVEEATEDMMAEADEAMDDMGDSAMAAAEEMVEEAADDMAPAESASASAGGACDLSIEVGDALKFSTNTLSAPSSCDQVTVTLTHTGNLPATAMGHNWVLMPASAVTDVATAGMGAGAANNYLPDDDRIVAATTIIGGGESASVTFSLSDLEAGTEYAYVCTFPGHWSVMRGTFTIA